MAFVHGSNATISLDGNALTSYVDSVGFDNNVALANVTAFGDDDDNHIAGLKSHSLSVSGHYDATQDSNVWAMFDGATVAISFSPDGGTTTYSGSGFCESYNISAPVGDKVSWTCTIRASGAITRA